MAGSQISADVFTSLSVLSCELPPVASTRPSARTVAETHCRFEDISWLTGVTTGCGPVMSIITEPFELPPICRIFPGRYMAALEVQPAYDDVNCPASVICPAPAVLT